MEKKIKVAVLMGGSSAERQISLVTGRAVCHNLDTKKYKVTPVIINKNGKPVVDQQLYRKINKTTPIQINDFKNLSEKNKIDIVFVAMHGPMGEDGCIQGLLETYGIKYTGSGVMASALAMNKVKTAGIYKQNGLDTPDFIDFKKKDWYRNKSDITKNISQKINFPCVIKPVNQGSSMGTYLVSKYNEIASRVSSSFKYSDWIMAQEYINGQEITCGVLERNNKAFSLPTTKVIANAGEFYDHESKYGVGGSTHICPADFDKKLTERIQTLAVKAHNVLSCRGMSRTDFFMSKKSKLYAIETNTIPGMTPTSLLPEAAAKMGISFPKMLDLIIKSSL